MLFLDAEDPDLKCVVLEFGDVTEEAPSDVVCSEKVGSVIDQSLPDHERFVSM